MKTFKANCGLLADIIHSHGVCHVVCSPGSRNAPAVLAMDACKGISTHVIIDERSAAFFALGLAQNTREPVALVCTSGTAVLNYAPAVAEAYYQGLPLIVISADRPAEWINQDDSQTINQPGVLSNFVKHTYDIPDVNPAETVMCNYVERLINDAMITALKPQQGPVHINLRLKEPLTGKPECNCNARHISYVAADDIISKEIVKKMADEAAHKKILIIAGFMLPDARLDKAMLRLDKLPNVYIMHETISNIHLPKRHNAIDVILSTLSESEKLQLAPDIVITIGGALISRQVKEYMRACSNTKHWIIGHHHHTVDCFNSLTLRIEADTARFLSMFGKFLAKSNPRSSYAEQWDEKKQKAIRSHNAFIENAPWSDLTACNILLKSLPAKYNLQLSNGTSIRYAQLCIDKMPHACYCNRGVSGIDGSVSTAIGASLKYPETTLLLTGDMSMAYDVGALALPEVTERLKIAVLNNQGGGIFRFINSTRMLPERERYLCSPPKLPLQALAEAYGYEYYSAANRQQLEKALPIFLSPRLSPAILEIITPGECGGDILRDYMNRNELPANSNPPFSNTLFDVDDNLLFQ